MRERKGSGFGRRSVASESKQAIKKYFLLYEGSDTEVLYFDAIEDYWKRFIVMLMFMCCLLSWRECHLVCLRL